MSRVSVKAEPASGYAAKVRQLRLRKARLDAFDDQIRRNIAEVESLLATLALGVPFMVEIQTDLDMPFKSLRFSRLANSWRLLLESADEESPGRGRGWGDEPLTPLSDSSRYVRSTVFREYVPRLLDHALAAMAADLEDRARTLSETADFMEQLREAGAGPANEDPPPDDDEMPF